MSASHARRVGDSSKPKLRLVHPDRSSVVVVVDVGTPGSGHSELFEALERDALKFGAQPVDVDLPDDLSSVQRRVADDLAYVLGIYEVLDGVGVPQPYSQRFGAGRLGVSHMTIRRALVVLVDRGVFVDCGETEPHRQYPRGTRLYLPGGDAA